MRDLIILACILGFWLLLGTSLTYIYQDPLIVSALLAENSSYLIDVDTSAVTANFSGTTIDMFTPTTESQTKGFLSMLGRMFTFRIPTPEGIPNGINVFIGSVNWLLVLFAGLIAYRLVRHGGG
jgi:hypothetical protein